jgi:hypothetical protein
MRRTATAIVGAAIAALVLAVPAAANGVDSPGENKDAVIAFYGADSLGDAISDGYYGNTSNPKPDGSPGIIPSASPGPTVGGCDAEAGASLGYAITGNGPSDVPMGNIPYRC